MSNNDDHLNPPDEPEMVECHDCAGEGYVFEQCVYCNGDGQTHCDWCDGDGEVDCVGCSGDGCDDCDFTGRVGCDDCWLGMIDCEDCAGDGEIEEECITCDGYGEVFADVVS